MNDEIAEGRTRNHANAERGSRSAEWKKREWLRKGGRGSVGGEDGRSKILDGKAEIGVAAQRRKGLGSSRAEGRVSAGRQGHYVIILGVTPARAAVSQPDQRKKIGNGNFFAC